jgi:hypothetical protein
MRAFRAAVLMAFAAAGISLLTASGALATGGTKVCVPEREGAAIKTPKGGACSAKFTLTELGAEGKEGKPGLSELSKTEQEALKAILPYIKYIASGVGGKPTIQFSGVNVQVVDGEGTTQEINGTGNLIIGYDEHTAGEKQTGSHNFIVGEDQEFTSFGGIVGGIENAITGREAFAVGARNTAGGYYTSVLGYENSASREKASVAGGEHNLASGQAAAVDGGVDNHAIESDSWIGGGSENVAAAQDSAIFGGQKLETLNKFEAIP